jgi:enamine deaminase RidA (YjgF/YER057c/UK114 family)
MQRQRISSGSTFEAQIGYSRAIVAGPWVFVSGTTGFDYTNMTIADSVVEQAEQCLKNIEAALAQAGATFADVVRVTYVLPDASEFEACWPVLRKYLRRGATGSDDDLGRAGRSAHEDRDRGDRPQGLNVAAQCARERARCSSFCASSRSKRVNIHSTRCDRLRVPTPSPPSAAVPPQCSTR